MRMRHRLTAAALLLSAVIHPVTAEESKIVSLPQDRIAAPDDGTMSGVVVLISNANGWDAEEDAARDAVVGAGAITVGVDLRQWLSALAQETDRDCLFLPADIERLSRELHRRHKADFYRPPRILGLGEGGALALAMAAQTPNGSFAETIGETVAIDPTEAVALPKPLCTPAPKRETASGTAYGLSPGTLPNPVRIVFSPAADGAAKAQAAALQQGHPDIVIASGEGTPDGVLATEATALVARLKPDDASLDLPLVEDIVPPEHDTLAIFYSGDGGWREIDQRIAARLNQGGVPVIGVDALRYFWSEKTPEETAADLSAIIKTYRKRLGIPRVVLIGYSFGANILPKVYGLLPEEDRKSVDLLSLLALSHQADFEIAVTGWMGVAGSGKHGDPVDHLAEVEPGKIQCVYGLEEEDTACPALGPLVSRGADLIARPGGHHFDENYELLAEKILARLEQR
ncbi:virulence factor family protein [Rhizobium sp. AAP43]|uniref:virulence factor family protein n=1 Tax=Rhizobium sp. AAP43 TaxID=1523420 RepID=UPI0006B907DE|nr:AcvB/VirJ family lysyl-phosphatidylglycerol hydrolase [Rhizobium sp. AAP43]KPF46978.1 type IV secretory pathway protein AcvB [Rhizobium sp. AAP43]